MLDCDNIHDDLKVLFICNGYLTEDETCGYDELIFAVRKEYLLKWLNTIADHEITEDAMNNWLREEYTSDDSYALYQDAQREKEIVFAQPVWSSRIKFYEVSESLRNNGEYEDSIFCRTVDYETAKAVYKKEKRAVLADKDFFLRDCKPEMRSFPEVGEMRLEYEDDEGNYYTLRLTGIEVEKEGR